MTPDEASRGGAEDLLDEDLPMLAANWLAAGWDSEPLRHLAGMSAKDAQAGGRSQLPEVMASLAYDLQRSGASRWEELPWRGYWGFIAWARNQMDQRLSPYAAAQRVLEIVGDVNELSAPAGRDPDAPAEGVGRVAGSA